MVITLILNIFPDQRYKKYIKLFAGLLLLAIIFHPILQWKKTKINMDSAISKYTHGTYDTDLEKEIEDLENKINERIKNGTQTEN